MVAEEFPNLFGGIIEGVGFYHNRCLMSDERDLFLKRMPDCTYIAEGERSMPGFGVAKDRLTLEFAVGMQIKISLFLCV